MRESCSILFTFFALVQTCILYTCSVLDGNYIVCNSYRDVFIRLCFSPYRFHCTILFCEMVDGTLKRVSLKCVSTRSTKSIQSKLDIGAIKKKETTMMVTTTAAMETFLVQIFTYVKRTKQSYWFPPLYHFATLPNLN